MCSLYATYSRTNYRLLNLLFNRFSSLSALIQLLIVPYYCSVSFRPSRANQPYRSFRQAMSWMNRCSLVNSRSHESSPIMHQDNPLIDPSSSSQSMQHISRDLKVSTESIYWKLVSGSDTSRKPTSVSKQRAQRSAPSQKLQNPVECPRYTIGEPGMLEKLDAVPRLASQL